MKAAVLAIPLALLSADAGSVGCVGCDESTWGYPVDAFDRYSVDANQRTPLGTAYDASGLADPAALIDRKTGEVDACLRAAGRGSADPRSFRVKIAADWVRSCDGSQELLPVEAPVSGCEAKGEIPTPACPCRWRAGIQCPDTIIATPSLSLFKDALIRWSTHSPDPWADPVLAACAGAP